MFETDIETAALKGVMLHQKDGTPYWKLVYRCCREGCNNILGECWCFSTEEAMLKAKEIQFHCSVACWAEDNPKDFEQSVKNYKKHIERCDPEEFEKTDWDDRDGWLWRYEEWLSDCYDGSEMAEMVGADLECPL